ncbi:MAG: hypothetical protein R3F60_13800 [bacterium]
MRTPLYVVGGLAVLALLSFFTLRLAAPNVVVAGQKATERQAVAELRTLLWARIGSSSATAAPVGWPSWRGRRT